MGMPFRLLLLLRKSVRGRALPLLALIAKSTGTGRRLFLNRGTFNDTDILTRFSGSFHFIVFESFQLRKSR
jgi:hypothetical protein